MKTDVVLLKGRIKPWLADLLDESSLQALMDRKLVGSRIVIEIAPEKDTKHLLCHAYARLKSNKRVSKKQRTQWEKAWRKMTEDKKAVVCRLTYALECAGASSKEAAAAHYVVQTDTDKGWFSEISAWYDTEHMPGLASVPGTIHAVRFLNADQGPKSIACYDLKNEDVLASPAWLAVRATDWSSKCRPHFKNTLRTMFRVLI
jgi:hypothetical protein|uniref:hypothetical protein n=1 Tax=Orrella sp. TaxID=1921583 RepID=UPI004047B621